MSPRQQRPSARNPRSAAAVRIDDTQSQQATATYGAPTWWVEAEAHLRQAARKLEVVGLLDPEAARMALLTYRLASRCRTDRMTS